MDTSKIKLTFLFLFYATFIQAEVDWIPSFDDAPVPAERSVAIDKALPKEPIVPVTNPRRILVYSATHVFRHASIPTGKEALTKLGKTTGAYEATVSDDPAHFEPEALQGFDAVVLLSPTRDFFMPHHTKREEFSPEDWAWLYKRNHRLVGNLVDYVAQGGGLVGIHSATDACYSNEAYGNMIGGYFDGHPWGANHNVTIVVEDPEHGTMKPVFGDAGDFQLVEEIYQFKEKPYSRDRLRVLLHVDPARSDPTKKMKREDHDYPVAWVQGVGEGRVFYTSIGHNHHIYSNPMMLKHYLAGIQFACGDLKANTTPSGSRP